jgi:hypothetical protein
MSAVIDIDFLGYWLVTGCYRFRSVNRLLVTANVPSSPILNSLMTKALCSSERSVLARAIWWHFSLKKELLERGVSFAVRPCLLMFKRQRAKEYKRVQESHSSRVQYAQSSRIRKRFIVEVISRFRDTPS